MACCAALAALVAGFLSLAGWVTGRHRRRQQAERWRLPEAGGTDETGGRP